MYPAYESVHVLRARSLVGFLCTQNLLNLFQEVQGFVPRPTACLSWASKRDRTLHSFHGVQNSVTVSCSMSRRL
ncbi:hypothetical protein PISMIDRAFT_686247 [Pisolithus microcarpus 441]|uniref:Uncharacterized protein n=1 Tax=Pisolithus microcarpus 441 TaxID=765257 RepID=A0A0C9YRK9_9AGAM|nr:hypothetical protein PISMIDRAFT_686247 [Pisolithus microcarpus 441]